jgi:hypothetical protein
MGCSFCMRCMDFMLDFVKGYNRILDEYRENDNDPAEIRYEAMKKRKKRHDEILGERGEQ